ncbi:hypothetical protein RAS1_40040 [Phycisphaerae bacterium RAS1]|nr:hypothetical protein RAS1_40040 [Phycisphaerae bacterium RAS1]
MASRFVAATDEVWRLQTGSGAECRFFQAMADRGHYRAAGGTRQGIYICTPGGRLLASINSLDADEVCKTLASGLSAWDALSPAERRLPADLAARFEPRWEHARPEGGLILETTNRDLRGDPPTPQESPAQRESPALPESPSASDAASCRDSRWNRDHAWFSRDEARAWLPADATRGAVVNVPTALVERLARFHLVDNVRGQTVPFTRADVAGSRIESRVTARDGACVEIELRGETRAVSGDQWDMSEAVWKPERAHPRGIVTRLLGQATFDLDAGRFTRFEMVGVGQRWGFSENNARRGQPERSAIGFVIRLASSGAAQSVPPAFVDVYDAAWLVRPAAAPAAAPPATGRD